MIGLALLLVAQPAVGEAAEQPTDPCAPRHHITRGGPPSPLYYIRTRDPSVGDMVDLSVHRCGERDVLRLERVQPPTDGHGDSDRAWVTTRHCPELARWARGVSDVILPAPTMTPPEDLPRPDGGKAYSISGWTTEEGLGIYVNLEVREPAGAPPNVLSGWIAEGERLFQACLDAGHGGLRWLPPIMPGRRP